MLIGYARISKADGSQTLNLQKDALAEVGVDRLGRNLKHLVNVVQDLSERGIGLRVLTGQGAQIDTTTASGRLIFGFFASLAEFERELIRERTMAGLKAARARGRMGGRPAKFDAKQKAKIYKLYSDGVYVSDLMQMIDAARPTIYKVINEYKAHSS